MYIKHLKCLIVIASSIICFNLIWNTKHRKTMQAMTNYSFSCFSCESSCLRKPERVSIVTGTYFSFLKSDMWMTFICNSWLGLSPQGLTPLCVIGRNWGHWEQVFTIWYAYFLKIPNYCLKPLLFQWCKGWDCTANCSYVMPIICLVYKSAVALHSGILSRQSRMSS